MDDDAILGQNDVDALLEDIEVEDPVVAVEDVEEDTVKDLSDEDEYEPDFDPIDEYEV